MLMDQSVRGPPWCCSLPLGMRALARVRRHLAPASVCVAPVCGSTSRVLAAGWAHTARPSCAAIQCMQTDWPACDTGGASAVARTPTTLMRAADGVGGAGECLAGTGIVTATETETVTETGGKVAAGKGTGAAAAAGTGSAAARAPRHGRGRR